jgi:hypothetical protein
MTIEVRKSIDNRSSHVYTTGFRCCNTLCLPFSDIVPLVVGCE